MYHAYSKPHVWSDGYYFFTFPNKQACAQFKQSVTMAGIGRFLPEPVWGDADQNKTRYTPETAVSWGYTIYAFVANAGAKGTMRGNWVENVVRGADDRYYLRIHVPGLEEFDPYWKRLVAQYK
jgi:hypothetical protein